MISTVGKPELHVISKQGEVDPSSLVYANDSHTKKHELNKTISTLIDANILRYTSEGFLAWHGRPQQHDF